LPESVKPTSPREWPFTPVSWLVIGVAVAVGCSVGIGLATLNYRGTETARGARRSEAGAKLGSQPRVLWSVDTDQKAVALTFDDGPDPRITRKILAILHRHGARATFFVEGRNAARYPELIRAEIAGGHEIANHTFNHRDFQFNSIEMMRREVTHTGGVIEKITGSRPRYLRPPRGHLHLDALKLADRLGYQVVMWSIGFERVKGFTLAQDADIVVQNLRPGLIVLAHDSSPTRAWVPKALPRLIRKIQARGYRIVTVGELAEMQRT